MQNIHTLDNNHSISIKLSKFVRNLIKLINILLKFIDELSNYKPLIEVMESELYKIAQYVKDDCSNS